MKSRDRLYIGAMISTALFAVLTIALMIGFKKNEAFFDSYKYVGKFAENEVLEAIEEQERIEYNYQYAKRNIDIEIEDKQEGKLCIPIKEELSDEDIDIRYEFTKNKFVITIKKQNNIIDLNRKIESDSSVMNAIGAYNIKEDTVVEIFVGEFRATECHFEIEEDTLNVSFNSIYDNYEKTVVLYAPYEQKSILSGFETDKNKNVKIFTCNSLQDEYTQQEVIDFANMIHADMIVGINVKEKSQTSYIKVIYNDTFYISNFGSIELSELSKDKFVKRTGIVFAGYKNADENDIVVRNAKIPATLVEIWIHKEDNQTNDIDYDLNHDMMTAMEDIIEVIK